MQKIISKTEAKKLETWLASAGRKLLFYHNDADGITSACMLLRFFSGFESDVRKGPVMEFLLTRNGRSLRSYRIAFRV
jgi:hypothetical protein